MNTAYTDKIFNGKDRYRKMIAIRMEGGLGNQMFQYALFLQLRALGRDVCIDDVTGYENQAEDSVRRPIRLKEAFGIDYPVLSDEDRYRLTDSYPGFFNAIKRKLRGRRSLEMHDQNLVFDPKFLETEEGYFTGYFQSYKYFAQVDEAEGAVRKAFTFREDLLDDAPGHRNILSQIRQALEQGEETCALHLRLGDYLDKPELYGGICTDAYYRAAVLDIQRSTGRRLPVFIFSNGPETAREWAEKNFTGSDFADVTLTCVSGADEEHAEKDLYLMTQCHHFILANSSFSWWAAYLGKERGADGPVNPLLEPDKLPSMVIAPSRWLKLPEQEVGEDIYTPDMIRMDENGDYVPGAGLGLL